MYDPHQEQEQPRRPRRNSDSGLLNSTNLVFAGCLVIILAGAAWYRWSNSPDRQARQRLEMADALAAEGQVREAAAAYREVALGSTDHAPVAAGRLNALLEGPVNDLPLADAVKIYNDALDVQKRQPSTFPQLYSLAIKRVEGGLDADPGSALTLLDAVAAHTNDEKKHAALRQKVLEKLVVKDPQNVDAANELAILYEKQNRLDLCKKVLEPHIKRLEKREGARILGHILTQEGRVDEAHDLLMPYTEGRLARLHEVEEAYRQGVDGLIQSIRNGTAPGFPYADFNVANDARKVQIYSEYLAQRFKEAPELKKLRDDLEREQPVVGAALDLGMVYLRRGQKAADADTRKKELQNAERMFLAIRQQAGETTEYQLFLGQVYYWLGRAADGRALFDKILARDQRKPRTLVGLARVLREVGAVGEARQLAEEAYNKETETVAKANAAGLRAVLFTDLDDEIVWLERALAGGSQHTRAQLASARGQKATRDGKEDEAARHLLDAVELYDKMEQNAATLNNGALACLALFHATGNRAHLNAYLTRLEKAATLEPQNSILCRNVADAVLSSAVRDVLGPALDLEAQRVIADLGYLSYLIREEDDRQALVKRLAEHKSTAAAIRHLERLALLAPKDPYSYTSLYRLQVTLRDVKGLRETLERVQKAELDLTDVLRMIREGYTGKDDDKNRRSARALLPRAEKVLERIRKETPGPNLAMAANYVAGLKLSLAALGEKVDLNEVVKLAEEAHQAAPSLATATTLVDVLLTRASDALARSQPAYAAMVARAKRSLGPAMMMSVIVERGGPLAEAALKMDDVKRAVDLIRQTLARFPSIRSERWMVLLRPGHPEQARELAQLIARDEIEQLQRQIEEKLYPLSASMAFRRAWLARMTGKEQEATDILKRAAAEKVPMPFDP